MAALMLMSCWVFFAPTKAEAASAGSYKWKVTLYVEENYDWKHDAQNIYVDYYTNNGYGSDMQNDGNSYFHVNKNQYENDKANYSFEGTSKGFPVRVRLSAMKNKNNMWNANYRCILYVKKGNDWVELKNTGKVTGIGAGKYLKDCTVDTRNSSNSNWPKATSISFSEGNQGVNIPTWGSNDWKKTVTATVKDQYGVNWYQAPASWSIGTTSAATQGYTGASIDKTGVSDSTTLTITPKAQTANKSTTGYQKDLYLKATRGNASGTVKFTLSNPNYTWTYNSNNPKSDLPVTIKRNGTTDWSSSATDGNYTETKRYYYLPSIYPTDAIRAGYTFKGFYSTKNNASYAKEESDFAPSGTKFSETNTVATGKDNPPLTYYAAWWAKNATVTLVDNGGNVVAKYTAKYDKPVAYVAGASIPTNVPFNRIGETGSFRYEFNGDWKVIDAKQYNADGTQSPYSEAYGSDIDYVIKGDTVFQAQYNMFKNSYTVDYRNENGDVLQNKSYSYRDNAQFETTAPAKAADNYFTYSFIGWHKVVGDEQKKGYVVNSEGFLSTSKTSDKADSVYKYIDTVDDFTVRADTTYVPVYEKTFIDYTVNFVYKDDEGNVITTDAKKYHYNDALETPEVPSSYNFDGSRHTLQENDWRKNSESGEVAGAMPTVATENATYYATYDAGIPSVYDVTFTYIDTDGTEKTVPQKVTHGSNIIEPTDVPQKYRDNENEYTFAGWLDQDGNAFNANCKKDLQYTAQYTASKLYTATFMNEGEQVGEVLKYVKGETIVLPATPTKEADVIASKYTFSGWLDQNGKANSVMGEEDLVFTAQYDPTYIDYTIKFVWKNADGSDYTQEKTYHYGDIVAVPENPSEYHDTTYKYEFKAWDNDVAKHCTENMTYTATYRKTYVYYMITFYKEVLGADGTIGYEEYTSDSFIYNEKIRIPVVAPDPAILNPGGDKNLTNKIVGWQYKDEEGNLQDFVSGMKIERNMEFYPVYKAVKSTRVVHLIDFDGKKIGDVTVEYNEALSDESTYSVPKRNYGDDVHYTFRSWVKEDGTDFDINTPITEEITLKASYSEIAHVFGEIVADKAPTFFETGLGTRTCECGKVLPDQVIEKIPDTKAPTAKLYVKDSIIETGDDVDMSESIYVAPSNDLILATDDKAEASEYNPDGNGIGTGKIEFTVSIGKDLLDYSEIADWNLRFDYDEYVNELKAENEKAGLGYVLTEDQILALREYETNTSAYVGDLVDDFKINDGDFFIFYAKITDRNGNVSYIHSRLLELDNTVPTVALSGGGNGGSKFCTKATATATDETELVSLTVDGKEVEIKDNTATVEITEAGIHQIIATDKAGNTTVKNITIVGEHKEKRYTTEATCENDGQIVIRCTVCGETVGEPIVIKKLGHKWEVIDEVAATCTDDGYTLERCANCGTTKKTVHKGSSTGEHTYGDWKVITAATCSTEGKRIKVCSVCHDTVTEIIPVDRTAHKWARSVVTRPTCTEKGYSTRICKLCGETETYGETEALGHEKSDEWVVTVEPTCTEEGVKVQYCVRCGDKYDAMATEKIPSTGHSWRWKENHPATADEEGYTLYVCMICGEERKTNIVDKLAKTTITFYGEDGTTVHKEFKDFVEGSVITAADVETPVKAEDEANKYVFSEWVNAETGEKVTLPLVGGKSDISLKAVFEARAKKFTVVFYNSDNSLFRRVGYLAYGEEVKLTSTPTKKNTKINSYEFIGWAPKDATQIYEKDIVDSEGNVIAERNVYPTVTATVNNAEYIAVFKETINQYKVTFAYSYTDVIGTITVDAGTDATFPADIYKDHPAKAADEKYHYTFKQWKGDSLENVVAPTLAIADFTATYHTVESEVIDKQPTCEEAGLAVYKCSCGYSWTKVLPALGHDFGDVQPDGKRHCSRCDATEDSGIQYTVKFYIEGEATPFKTIGFLSYGADISERIPTPKKSDTDTTTYVFDHWYKLGDPDKKEVKIENIITADAAYVAMFKETVKKYKVIYAIDAEHVLQISEVEAGSKVLPEYTGATPTSSKFDTKYHYVFYGWSKTSDDYPHGIVSDVYITAVFIEEDHIFESQAMRNATCTEPTKEIFKCKKCDCTYEKTTGKALGHSWKLVSTVEPTETVAGYELYKCTRCSEEYKKEIPAKAYIYFTVTVVDQNGKPVQGATVSIFDGTKFVASALTEANGKVTFRVEAAKKYRVVVEYDKQHVEGDITVNPDGSTSGGSIGVQVTHCSCTCHRDGLWPAIFRFFHKIIKMLTGEFGCCGDPDSRYGK